MDDRIEAAKDGDPEALTSLLDEHYPRIWTICRRLCGNDADAADATQEALIAVVRGLPGFDGRSQLGTWIHRIASNAALDELRRRSRRPEPAETRDEAPAVLESSRSDVRMDLDGALAMLEPEFRRAFLLREVSQLDYESIAELEGIPIGTVRSRIARAKRKLVEILRAGNYFGSADVENREHG